MSVHGSSGVGEEMDQAHQGLVRYLCSTRSPLRGQGSMKSGIYTVRETVPGGAPCYVLLIFIFI